ncbi:ABC transporter permease [Streptomyces sp. A3M-1-3]|uniref:ABC transporter permease n=1 Tax=Streptomyces sp. A3M-1-3 TaxID=2962044 RepID=UPI0020B87DAD|nr:ABC transporter permease [Streptomyces sp. A3M-1-3]MCP3822298.1 ABC transporter permease [Streptomyces sp. A3M-1-3]
MSALDRRRHLLRIGKAAGRRAESGGMRFLALLCATASLAVGLAAFVVVHASYAGQESREAARGPVDRVVRPDLPAAAVWEKGYDSLQGSGQFPVFFISPLTADAPLPPGVREWPEPGEAVLSPALLRSGASEKIAERYGRLAGIIGEEGLADPEERAVYVRPLREPTPVTEGPDQNVIVGYGQDLGQGRNAAGASQDYKAQWVFQSMVAGLLLLPAVVLLTVAVRSGSQARDRRTALIAVLGGSARDRALIAVGEAWRATCWGGVLAFLPILGSLVVSYRLPWVGFTLSLTDTQRALVPLLLAPLCAVALVLVVAVVADQVSRRPGRSTRPAAARRSPVLWAVLCPVMILVAVRGPDFVTPGTSAYTLINWCGVAGTLATLPAAVAVGTSKLGGLLARAGRSWGRPGLLVAGQRASSHPRPIARMTAGVVVALTLLVQIVAWQGLFGSQAQAAEATKARIGSSALVVRPGGPTDSASVSSFLRESLQGAAALALVSPPGAEQLVFTGPCESLKLMHLPCPASVTRLEGVPRDPRVRELIQWYGDVAVQRGDVAEAAASADAQGLVMLSPEREDLSVPAIKRAAYRAFPTGAHVDSIGAEWLPVAVSNRDQGRWIALLGLVGIGILAAAAGFGGLTEMLRHGKALAPLSVLTGNRGFFWNIAAWTVFVPLMLAALVGEFVGVWIAGPTTANGASFVSGTFLALSAAVVGVLSLLLWLWGATLAVRQAADWRPRGD